MLRFWADGKAIPTVCDTAGQPLEFRLGWQRHQVQEIVKQWELDDDWWEVQTMRTYFKLITKSGFLVVLYWDAARGEWFLQRIYD